jgi:hypothetical protein
MIETGKKYVHLLGPKVALFADFVFKILGAPVELSGKVNDAIPI